MLFFPHLIVAAVGTAPGAAETSSKATPAEFRLPLSIDFALHAAPALSLLFDFLVLERHYTKKEMDYHVPITVGLYALFYGWWVEHCAARNGNICKLWYSNVLKLSANRSPVPYPFLTMSKFPVRVLIYGGAAVLAVGSFKVLNNIHPR